MKMEFAKVQTSLKDCSESIRSRRAYEKQTNTTVTIQVWDFFLWKCGTEHIPNERKEYSAWLCAANKRMNHA